MICIRSFLIYWSSIWQPWHLASIFHGRGPCHVRVLEIVDSDRRVLSEVYVGSTRQPLMEDKQSIHYYERAITNLHFPLSQERMENPKCVHVGGFLKISKDQIKFLVFLLLVEEITYRVLELQNMSLETWILTLEIGQIWDDYDDSLIPSAVDPFPIVASAFGSTLDHVETASWEFGRAFGGCRLRIWLHSMLLDLGLCMYFLHGFFQLGDNEIITRQRSRNLACKLKKSKPLGPHFRRRECLAWSMSDAPGPKVLHPMIRTTFLRSSMKLLLVLREMAPCIGCVLFGGRDV